MKVLEPISNEDIPRHWSPHEELYQRVLALNGKTLPVEFDNPLKALRFANLNRHPNSRATRLGVGAKQRGNTVFLYRK